MKAAPIAFFVTFAAATVLALDITTRDGTVYENVEVRRVEPDGITIKHSSGLTKIHARNLSDADREQYHLTPEAARAYAAQQRQARADYATAASKADALQREERAQSLAEAHASQKEAKRQLALEAAARNYTLFCVRMVSSGIYCRDNRGHYYIIPDRSTAPQKWFHIRAVPTEEIVRISTYETAEKLIPVGFDPNDPNVVLRKEGF